MGLDLEGGFLGVAGAGKMRVLEALQRMKSLSPAVPLNSRVLYRFRCLMSLQLSFADGAEEPSKAALFFLSQESFGGGAVCLLKLEAIY